MRWLAANGVRVLVVAVAILAATTVGALAFWQGAGSGTTTAALAEPQPLSFTPGTPTSQLYPGAETDVALVVSNSNTHAVRIDSVVLDTAGGGPFAVDSAHETCAVSTLSFLTQDNDGAGWSVPPRTGTINGTLAIDMPAALKMSAAAANGCQGANFTVQLEGGP